MRKVLFIAIAVLMVACSPKITPEKDNVWTIEKKDNFFAIDFTKYSDKGFLFTPEQFKGDYKSVGIVDYLLVPGAKKEITKGEMIKTDQGMVQDYIKTWTIDAISINQALDNIYDECIKMGADAVVNFEITLNKDDYPEAAPAITIEGYRVTGFAIKRK